MRVVVSSTRTQFVNRTLLLLPPLGLTQVVEELAAQAPAATLLLLSLPPLQPAWPGCGEEERRQ